MVDAMRDAERGDMVAAGRAAALMRGTDHKQDAEPDPDNALHCKVVGPGCVLVGRRYYPSGSVFVASLEDIESLGDLVELVKR